MKINMPKWDLPSKITVFGFFGGMIITLFGARAEILPVGIAGFVLIFISFFAGQLAARTEGIGKPTKLYEKYAALLQNEDTRSVPEVAELMIYTDVQRVFFDPAFIDSEEAQSSPYVAELLLVFDKLMRGEIRLPAGAQYSFGMSELSSRQAAQREKERKKTPRRIIGSVLRTAGILMFLAPFIKIFAGAFLQRYGATVEIGSAFSLPVIGFVLVLVGSLVSR